MCGLDKDAFFQQCCHCGADNMAWCAPRRSDIPPELDSSNPLVDKPPFPQASTAFAWKHLVIVLTAVIGTLAGAAVLRIIIEGAVYNSPHWPPLTPKHKPYSICLERKHSHRSTPWSPPSKECLCFHVNCLFALRWLDCWLSKINVTTVICDCSK